MCEDSVCVCVCVKQRAPHTVSGEHCCQHQSSECESGECVAWVCGDLRDVVRDVHDDLCDGEECEAWAESVREAGVCECVWECAACECACGVEWGEEGHTRTARHVRVHHKRQHHHTAQHKVHNDRTEQEEQRLCGEVCCVSVAGRAEAVR